VAPGQPASGAYLPPTGNACGQTQMASLLNDLPENSEIIREELSELVSKLPVEDTVAIIKQLQNEKIGITVKIG
jgi:hypothetical protein